MAKNSDNLIYFTLRLNLDNPQHMKVGKVLKNLNPKQYKSVNKYMIDAIEFFIDHGNNLYLGNYYVKEITAPEGYLLDEEEHDVVCDYEGDLVAEVSRSTTSAEQVMKQPFQMIKVSDNGEDSARVNDIMDGLIEKVGLFAMEKQSISVDAVKENFSINNDQAEGIIKQLETIGVLDKRDADGNYKVVMDKDAFLSRVRGYQDLAERMRAVAASKNMNLSDVTISKTLIVQENDHAVKTRIPGTWGEKVQYIWINKENIMEIHNGKTMLTFLDKNKEYKIYDADNRVVKTIKGDELYKGHYDKVASGVRERYEKKADKNNTHTVAKTTTTQRRR